MEDHEERQLIEAARGGNREAVGQLVSRYERQIFYFIYRMTGSRDDAKDLTQEVFIKVFRGISGFNGKSTFQTWLYRIATNHTLNFLARRPPPVSEVLVEGLPDPSPSSQEQMESDDLQRIVQRAIRSLPERQRAIVTLRIQEGLTYTEMAEVLKCSVGNCKAAYHHAVKKLREVCRNEAIL